MAENKKISELTSGGTIRATDDIPVVREGQTVRVQAGSAAGKAASDPAKPVLASVSGAITPGHLAVFADDDGTVEDGGAMPEGIEALLAAQALSAVHLDDYIPVIQNGVLYRALVSDVLAATPPPSSAYTDAAGAAYTDAAGVPYTSAT